MITFFVLLCTHVLCTKSYQILHNCLRTPGEKGRVIMPIRFSSAVSAADCFVSAEMATRASGSTEDLPRHQSYSIRLFEIDEVDSGWTLAASCDGTPVGTGTDRFYIGVTTYSVCSMYLIVSIVTFADDCVFFRQTNSLRINFMLVHWPEIVSTVEHHTIATVQSTAINQLDVPLQQSCVPGACLVLASRALDADQYSYKDHFLHHID